MLYFGLLFHALTPGLYFLNMYVSTAFGITEFYIEPFAYLPELFHKISPFFFCLTIHARLSFTDSSLPCNFESVNESLAYFCYLRLGVSPLGAFLPLFLQICTHHNPSDFADFCLCESIHISYISLRIKTVFTAFLYVLHGFLDSQFTVQLLYRLLCI